MVNEIRLWDGSVVEGVHLATNRADLEGAARVFYELAHYREFSRRQGCWLHWTREGVYQEVTIALREEQLADPHYLARHNFCFIPKLVTSA